MENNLHPPPEGVTHQSIEDALFSAIEGNNTDNGSKQPQVDERESDQQDDKDADEQQEADKNKDNQEAAEEPEEGTEAEEDDSEDSAEQPNVFKIGNKEYSKIEDVIEQANKMNGRNAYLAGQVKHFKSEAQTLSEQLRTAAEYNKQWAQYFDTLKAQGRIIDEGTEPEAQPKKDLDVDELTARTSRKVVEELEARENEKTLKQQLRQELTEISQLSNFEDVSELIETLSDKINPITGKYFTPKQAYKHACIELGIENELIAKKQQPAVQTQPPKKVAKQIITSSAARPTATRAPVPAKSDNTGDNLFSSFAREYFY